MTSPKLLLTVLAAAVLAAGCGGGPDVEKEVKDDLSSFISAREAGDASAICNGVTPESRELFDTIAKGRHGDDARCVKIVDERFETAEDLGGDVFEAVEEADVDVEGDIARVNPPDDDDERLTMRKVQGDWAVDMVSFPKGVGYSLQASAVCTENNLRLQRLALPAPTRTGIAGEAERDADGFGRMARLLQKLGAPEGKEREHETILAFQRASEREWRRAASRLKGLGAPLATYNRALKGVGKRARGLRDEQRELGIACLGFVETREGADDYRREAERICARTLRRMKSLPTASTAAEAASLARRGGAIGRRTSAALNELDPPEGLETIHRRSADRVREAYGGLKDLAAATDLERAQEKFELGALPSAIGFLRIGLQTCAQL